MTNRRTLLAGMSASAFMPAAFQGTPLGNASVSSDQARIPFIENRETPRDLQRQELDLLNELNQEQLAATGPDAGLEGRINSFELAFRMQAAALSQAAPNGAATLTWQPPTLNTDGSTLTDLTAFKVYWSTTQGTYSQTLSTKISSAYRTHTVSGLPRGTWYFVVTALNSQGIESPYSGAWKKTIQ